MRDAVSTEDEQKHGGWIARSHERRAGLHEVLRTLARALQEQEDSGLSSTLTRKLATLVPVREVRLTDLKGAPVLKDGAPIRARDYVAFAVPTADARRHVVLEASFDGEGLDGWSMQLLESAARLAGLVCAVEGPAPVRPAVTRGGTRHDGAAPLIGSSSAMQLLRERVERVAATDFTVLIEGESGTGKELVACQVHELSHRRHGPFVAVNCAALVETLLEAELFGIEERTATGVRGRRGKFEHADGGTLFLDEIAELSMAAQAKLLRAIQDLTVERVGGHGGRRVDLRIVAATNRNLASLVERGLFRADLYYRLSGLEVRVPPLRQRREDIIELAQYFVSRGPARQRYSISAAAFDALTTYGWPGNVRELERMIEGAIATAESHQIGLDDLPVSLRGSYGDVLMPSVQAGDTMRAWGSRYARLVLERCHRNKRQACRVLGITYHTLNAYLNYEGKPRVRATASERASAVDITGEAADQEADAEEDTDRSAI